MRKNNLLKYLPKYFFVEKIVNSARIFEFNKNAANGQYIVYLMEREIRTKDNFALQFAILKSKELHLPLKIIYKKIKYDYKPKNNFINNQVLEVQNQFFNLNLDFEIIKSKNILDYLNKIKTAILIIDFNPILDRNFLKQTSFKIYEIDGHNIIPARFISNKQEYNAFTFRKKVYNNIYPFITEFDNKLNIKTEADFLLEKFIKDKLPLYNEFKNNPAHNVLSGLSKYLTLGFISSQRVVLEIIKSDVDDINKESFLEELIVRKEVAENFCLHCKNFQTIKCTPNWAKESLKKHSFDLRFYNYSLEELKKAKTHDRLWNATQNQLVKEGLIHGYLRMYWAKKIMEWSKNADIALKNAIYLNDKYAYDSPSANGYVGILWAIAGLHDRAFRDFPITGKIRRMTFKSIQKKFDIEKYINTY